MGWGRTKDEGKVVSPTVLLLETTMTINDGQRSMIPITNGQVQHECEDENGSTEKYVYKRYVMYSFVVDSTLNETGL